MFRFVPEAALDHSAKSGRAGGALWKDWDVWDADVDGHARASHRYFSAVLMQGQRRGRAQTHAALRLLRLLAASARRSLPLTWSTAIRIAAANSLHLAEYLKGNILRFPDGIFWAPSGKKFEQDLAA